MQDFTFDLAKFVPFRDRKACERVRKIKKENICHSVRGSSR